MPKWNRFINYTKFLLIIAPTISSIVYAINYKIDLAYLIVNTSLIASLLFIFIILYQVYQLGDTFSRYFFYGTVVLVVMAFVGVFFLIFPIEIRYFAQHVIQGGIIFQILIFAVGLGYKIQGIEKDKQESQLQLIQQLERNQNLQTKVNRELKQKVAERTFQIEQQKEKIMAQRDDLEENNSMLEQQNHEITEQKILLEKSHKDITDSINYASLIQNAALTKTDLINNYLPQSFLIFKPKNVVSGDFYFIKKLGNRIIVMAADCTGHGVPGAFLSMLGISFLNEIIRKDDSITSAEILNQLREYIKTSLQQTGAIGEQRDGMDAAICILDNKAMIANFAGAHNPIWIYRNHEDSRDIELIEVKGDKQPVGIYLKEKPFTDHYIQLELNDMVYLFSDGFHTQFGGEKGKTLKTSNFKSLLLKVYNKSPQVQREDIENAFNKWKGNYSQLDDVLVIGFRI